MTNTFFEFHIGLSECPPKFHLETNKETAFFIVEGLEVSKGSDCSDLIFLS